MSSAYQPELTEEQIRSNPNVLFTISRSKNKNLVVYEANLNHDKTFFSKDNALHIYWMSIDPEYVKAARQAGRNTDREELNYVEQTMAYGASIVPNHHKHDELKVNLAAVPKMNLVLQMLDGRPRAITHLKNKSCFLSSIYVKSTESWIGLPTVDYVEASGVCVKTGETVIDRIQQ